jgi:hypothetical protein
MIKSYGYDSYPPLPTESGPQSSDLLRMAGRRAAGVTLLPMTSTAKPVERISAAEIWVCALIAVVSVLTSPITAIMALVGGGTLALVGASWGASSRSDRGRLRGVRVLLYGLAILAGPFVYLTLAVIVRLAER